MVHSVALWLTLSFAQELPAIDWQDWSPAVFTRATSEHKLVLLDLGAVWCHWCHVMESTTYADAAVVKLIRSGYLAVRVDQDARPDLATRYEDYGWPATILFNAKGEELAKLRGYIEPARMASLLQAFLDDPTPGPSVLPQSNTVAAGSETLSEPERAALLQQLEQGYDAEHGGWGHVHKYLLAENVEFELRRAMTGNAAAAARARETLDRQRQLIDPVWGGVYQYSHGGVWSNPHFEKIMAMQADNLRLYAMAAAQFDDARYLQAAQSIHRYLVDFLCSEDGAFFTSQDADVIQGEHAGEYFAHDDAGRRALGMPRIDRHVYARENGWAIEALCELYAVAGDAQVLAEAKRAADWIIAHRAQDDGGFRHDAEDPAGPYLADSLAMGRALLALYVVSGERAWLERAARCATFIASRFATADATGYFTAPAAAGTPASWQPSRQIDENVALARWGQLLARYTGDEAHRTLARCAARLLSAPAVARRRGFATGGLLLADLEAREEPAHVTVVGSKQDASARELFLAALRHPVQNKRIDWFDAAEGPLANPDVDTPRCPARRRSVRRRPLAPRRSPIRARLRDALRKLLRE
ncbi:MAG: DUF255 domain-containing protein [Planctomycetota bacterium]